VKKIISKLKDEKGQTLVEFALVLIVLLLISLGIAEFGRAWYRADTLKNAANIAARTYAITSDPDKARDAARAVISGLNIGDCPTAANETGIIEFTPTAEQVNATVCASFNTVVPGFFPMLDTITLSRDATYRLES